MNYKNLFQVLLICFGVVWFFVGGYFYWGLYESIERISMGAFTFWLFPVITIVFWLFYLEDNKERYNRNYTNFWK